MKKFLAIFLLVALVLPLSVSAKTHKPDKIVSLPASEIYDGDYFAYGDIVEISGTVNGDVYAAGGQVTIDGIVNGDLMVAGGTVNISGVITQDVRVAGGTVIIDGIIQKNLTVVSGNVDILKSATLGGNVTGLAGNMTLASVVPGNIKVGASNLTISGQVNGDVETWVETLRLSSGASINGDLTYFSNEKASIDEGALVLGETQKKQANKKTVDKSFSKFRLLPSLYSMVVTLILGLILAKLFPNFTKRAAYSMEVKKGILTVVGITALIIIPILSIILFVTILGIPFSLGLLFIYFITIYVSRIYFMTWIGKKISTKIGQPRKSWVLNFVVGFVVYYILAMIPIIGGVTAIIAVVLGTGALIIAKKEIYKLGRDKGIF